MGSQSLPNVDHAPPRRLRAPRCRQCHRRLYTSGWTYEGPLCSGHCAGNPSDSVKFTLAKCTYVDSLSLYTMISSVTGGYTWQSFSDASCSTLTGINDGLSVDTCTEHPGTSSTPCVQVLRAGSGYASGATNTYDCTSGTCGDCITCSACKCSSAPCIRTKS